MVQCKPPSRQGGRLGFSCFFFWLFIDTVYIFTDYPAWMLPSLPCPSLSSFFFFGLHHMMCLAYFKRLAHYGFPCLARLLIFRLVFIVNPQRSLTSYQIDFG